MKMFAGVTGQGDSQLEVRRVQTKKQWQGPGEDATATCRPLKRIDSDLWSPPPLRAQSLWAPISSPKTWFTLNWRGELIRSAKDIQREFQVPSAVSVSLG